MWWRCSTPFGRRGWLRLGNRYGECSVIGGGEKSWLLSFVFMLTQHKVKKAACDRREDWCAEQPTLLSPLPPLYLTVRDSTERAEIDSLPTQRYRACFSHGVIWDSERVWRTGRDGMGSVGLVLVEMTARWCGDRQGWLELRNKWKTETEMEKQRPASFHTSCVSAWPALGDTTEKPSMMLVFHIRNY